MRECGSELVHDGQQLFLETEYDDARGEVRRMPQDIREVAIKADQHPCLACSNGEEVLIGGTREFLVTRQRNVMSCTSKNGRHAVGHILVELHGATVMRISERWCRGKDRRRRPMLLRSRP